MYCVKLSSLKIPLTLFISFACLIVSFAQPNLEKMNKSVGFSNEELSLKECLNELNEVPDINIIYSGTKEFRRFYVEFPQKTMTVKDAIEIIKSQAPVEIVEDGDYIIVRLKELERSYIFKGNVSDKETREILVGVNMYSLRSNFGIVTDAKGNFRMQLRPDRYRFVISYIGYKQKTITIPLFNNTHMDIQLEPSKLEIEEVKITASNNEFEKLKIGRTIEKIEAKTINNLNNNDINDALLGRINGVWVTKVSGAPGDHNKIRIRGISSIYGSTDPLYVVDGMIVPIVNFKTLGISDLNSHDISQLTVLKDASSTALYGFLGGNGVVDIKTKTGGGKKEYTFSAKRGFQYFNNRYDLLRTEDFIESLRISDDLFDTKYLYEDPDTTVFTKKYPEYIDDSLKIPLGYNDFQDILFRNGVINEYQFSAKGSLKTVDYYISGNYYNHKGIIENTKYNKYSFVGNFSKKFFERLTLRLFYKGSYQENINNLDNYLGNKSILRCINYEPAYYSTPYGYFMRSDRLFLNNNEYASVKTLSDFKNSSEQLLFQELRQKNQTSHSVTTNTNIEIFNSLQFKAIHSLAYKNLYFLSMHANNENYLYSDENYIILSQQYDLDFDKTIGFHKLNSFVRYRYYRDNIYWNIDSTNIEPDGFTIENDLYLRGSQSIFGVSGSVQRAINSAIASCVSYSYKEKYFVSFIVNYDNITEGYYVDSRDLFPSIAVNYDLSKEYFLHLPEWIDVFNIYLNWGKSGNYPLNSLSNDLFIDNIYYTNGEHTRAIRVSNLANHYLKHEAVVETNYGVNISLFNNAIALSGDYYTKYNKDLIIHRQIPYYYGGGDIVSNIGEMENKGIELSLEFVPFKRPEIYWSSRFGYSSNKQVITTLYDENGLSFNHTDILYPDFYARENEVLGSITGYEIAGEWDEEIHSSDENETNPKYINLKGLAYVKHDTLSPNELVENDKVVIGNSVPDFILHWLNTFEYKNFSCEMLWYSVIGVDKYNATRASTFITGLNANVKRILSDTLNYFTAEQFYESSYFIEDASFIRLKTLSFTYNQPKKIASRFSISYTLSFENILTITNYTGYDPESTVYTNNNFSDNALDRGAYPSPKGIYINVQIKF